MTGIIVKLADKYLIWSSVVDAPVTYGMTLDELTEYIREEEGKVGLSELPARLKRVEQTGTSHVNGLTPAELILGNRAGYNETCLDMDELIQRYVTDVMEPVPAEVDPVNAALELILRYGGIEGRPSPRVGHRPGGASADRRGLRRLGEGGVRGRRRTEHVHVGSGHRALRRIR